MSTLFPGKIIKKIIIKGVDDLRAICDSLGVARNKPRDESDEAQRDKKPMANENLTATRQDLFDNGILALTTARVQVDALAEHLLKETATPETAHWARTHLDRWIEARGNIAKASATMEKARKAISPY